MEEEIDIQELMLEKRPKWYRIKRRLLLNITSLGRLVFVANHRGLACNPAIKI